MLFTSHEFLFIFFPLVLLVYFVLLRNSRRLQNIFLTIVSLFFYAWGEPYFVLIMIASILCNWLFGMAIDRHREHKKMSKLILGGMLLVNLGILCIFKYLMFTLSNINALFNSQISIPQILLPLGISFFTFQAISYVIDIYRGDGQVQKNPLNVALYISFFPQLIAGPIVRYQTIAEQIDNRQETWHDFNAGLVRFCIGLAKKMIIANNIAIVADTAFAGTGESSVLMAWMGAVAYTLQIYFDFSAYSDMAIGLGRMFGFRFLENFNYPYISRSISEFWRRWHISLGTWFRDYVYIPLGGNRVSGNFKLLFNVFIVWLLTGIWHGANWTFIVWGMMYFVLISIEKYTNISKRLSFLGYFYTMFFVIIGWVIFRAVDLTQALTYIQTMLLLGNRPLCDELSLYYLYEFGSIFAIGILFSLPIMQRISGLLDRSRFATVVYVVSLVLVLIVSLSFVIKGGHNPFIYSNF